MPEFRGYLDHPCFFIHDAEIDLGPEDVPSTDWPTPPYIRRTDRMIAVGTIADVDGDVHICLDQEAALEGLALFDGHLSTPSGVLSITQSSGEEILRANVREETALSIGVDDLRNPRRIHVRVQN